MKAQKLIALMIWMVVLLFACGPAVTSITVIDKQERNDLLRKTARTECGITIDIPTGNLYERCNTVYDNHYDRSGYVLILMYRYADESSGTLEIEVSIDDYRLYSVGDRYPRNDIP